MSKHRSSNRLFEARWNHRGKIETLFSTEDSGFKADGDQKILGVREASPGRFVGTVRAASSAAAHQIVSEHMLCVILNFQPCKHV